MSIETDIRRQIEMRHAEVLGGASRIAPLDRASVAEKVQIATCRLIGGIRGIDDMSPPPVETIPEIMFTLCRFPELWQAVMDVTIPLQGPASKLPHRERKIAILRTGWLCGAPYEFGEHVGQAKRLGFTEAEIEAVVVGSAHPAWTDHERAVLEAVEELHESAMICDDTWSALARGFDEAQLFEFLILVGQFTATAYFQNALRLRLESNNVGLGAR